MSLRLSKLLYAAGTVVFCLAAVALLKVGRQVVFAADASTQPVDEYQSIDISSNNAVWHLSVRPDGSGRLVYGAAMGRDLPAGTYDFKGLRAGLHEGAATGFWVAFQPQTGNQDQDPFKIVKVHPSAETTRIRALYDIAFSAPPIQGHEGAAKDLKEWLKTNPLLPPPRKTPPTTQAVFGCRAMHVYGEKNLNLLLRADGSGALYVCERGAEIFPGSDDLSSLTQDEWDAVLVESMHSPSVGTKRGITFPAGTFDFPDSLHSIGEESGADAKVVFIPAYSGFKNIPPEIGAAEVKKLFGEAFNAKPDPGEDDLLKAILECR